jgi:uncharacterized membrane protein
MSNKPQKTPPRQIRGAQITTASYYGPIPPASEMVKYEEACPGLPDRIMTMAEGQLTHRQEIELIAIKTSSRNSTLGVVFAFILAMTTLLIGGFCIYLNKDFLGSLIGSLGIGSIVATFVYGTRSNRLERQEKEAQN